MNDQDLREKEKKKDLLAWGCIALAIIGLLLGMRFTAPLGGVFSAGTTLSFLGFLLSMAAVKDHGSNLPALLAFTVTFLSMAVCIFCTGMAG